MTLKEKGEEGRGRGKEEEKKGEEMWEEEVL